MWGERGQRPPPGGVRERRSRSLEQIEDDYWGDPPPDTTYLISTCHRLRRVPVEELEAEDLRILLGQLMSLRTLVPRALRLLERDPTVRTHFGTLFEAVQRLPDAYWRAHPDQHARLLRTKR
ncbi:hypothetical protein GCM10027445_31500 [Amycolatopsis endophytica]|uniref:Uncharacterized protein n=1 Tax=Amycolatopsis endophytica TaxID=860233 RepID=A0A853B1S0_9PSEU|nr:contact-dependent growth inhibition system immunity protein [Amycolatopsis endophytica]NYI88774.1 hypothetical protein [Amycolatopsis endophytica]